MILYHFCAAHMLQSILRSGITLGHLVEPSGKMTGDHQWLTSDKNPDNQSWATRGLIGYDRTAYRLTVNIPDSRHRKLHLARCYLSSHPIETIEFLLDGWSGSNDWYIYTGKIPPRWIVGYKKMRERN